MVAIKTEYIGIMKKFDNTRDGRKNRKPLPYKTDKKYVFRIIEVINCVTLTTNNILSIFMFNLSFFVIIIGIII